MHILYRYVQYSTLRTRRRSPGEQERLYISKLVIQSLAVSSQLL